MKTIVHAFNFDTLKPADKAAYDAMRAELAKDIPHKMRSLSLRGERTYYATGTALDGTTIELETTHLFDNQWNTGPIVGMSDKGLRVFDWAEDAVFDARGNEKKNLRRGYWLEQTAEMKEIRRNTMACGYCGKQEPAAKGYVFCPHCIDSEYLKEPDLCMTRMRPIDQNDIRKTSLPLTEAERAHLLPLYREAQLHGSTERGKARIAKAKQDIESEYNKTIEHATAKRDGFRWLMAHGIDTNNCIYYSHTRNFSFGWRTPLSAELCSALLNVVSEFPFPYEIKCADGKVLEGY